MTIGITYFFVDDDGAKSKVLMNIPASSSSPQSFAAGVAALLRQISDATLTRYNIHQTIYEPSLPGAGDGNWQGCFFLEGGGGNAYVTSLPGIKSSKLLPDGITLDQADADVAAVIDALINGIGGIQPCGVGGDDLSTLLSAYKQHRVT